MHGGRARSNLPAETTGFVGRRHDLAEVRRLLSTARLVTVTGIGGVGKTRIALRAAGAGARAFRGGTWLVSLSEWDGSTPVAELVAQVLDMRDQSTRRHADSLADFLRDKRLLLVLDACERQADECADLCDELLRAAPGLRILATSRVPLRVGGEHVYPLAPLPVDAPGAAQSDATELFRARVAAIPGVEVAEEELPRVVELCRRLDGIPLAIELAAACLLALSVQQVTDRLNNRFRLLSAHRVTEPRHRTLRAAIDGSFELCLPPQRLLWARLSVFAGEFDLAAVEAICAGDDMPVLDVLHHLGALVEQSVVTRVAGGGIPRFHLLDTIREYGSQRLDERGDAREYRHRHRDYYAALAAEAEQAWTGPDQLEWFVRLRREQGNLRAALDSFLDDPATARAGAELAACLWFFWIAGGYLREGRRFLELALIRHPVAGRERRRALWAGAFVAGTQGDLDRAEALAAECLEDAVKAADGELHACALETLGMVAAIRGDLDVAVDRLTAALGRHPDSPGPGIGRLRTLPCLGVTRIMRGEIDDALALARQAGALCRESGERWQRSYVDYLTALALRTKGEPDVAAGHVGAAIELKYEFRDVVGLVMCLELLAGLLADRHEGARAVQLLGATETLCDTFGLSSLGSPFHSAEYQQCADQARRLLGEAAYEKNLRVGRAFDLDQAVACALERESAAPTGSTKPQDADGPRLTRREAQIAELIAEGLSNREIAERLSIATRTAESHVEHILTKLGFGARTQVAAWIAATRQPPTP